MQLGTYTRLTVLLGVAAAAVGWLGVAGWLAVVVLLASIGTDGEDGPTDAAGAVADAEVVAAIMAAGSDVPRALARCAAYPLLAAAGGLVVTGPTGTNVADVRLVLVRD